MTPPTLDSLAALVAMTCELGRPENDYVLGAEGNTSMRIDSNTFWIKASGSSMHEIGPEGFVAMRFDAVLKLLVQPPALPEQERTALRAARVDAQSAAMPSVETGFHAVLLNDTGCTVVGHTHPTAINAILCSSRAAEFAADRRTFDEAIHCGPESVLIPYTESGAPLALAVRSGVRGYMDFYGEAPRIILLANHGLIVLGHTPDDVQRMTAAVVKAARIFAGACAIGEPTSLGRDLLMAMSRRKAAL